MTEEKSSYLTTLEKEYHDFQALYQGYRDNLVERLQHWWGEHVGDLSPEAFLDTFSSIVDGLYANLQGSDLEVLHEEDAESPVGSGLDVSTELTQLKTMLYSMYGATVLKRLHLEVSGHTIGKELQKELDESIQMIEDAQKIGESVLPEQNEPWKPTWRQESLLARLQQLRAALPPASEETPEVHKKRDQHKRFKDSLALAREVHAQLARLGGAEEIAAKLRSLRPLTPKDAAEQADHLSHPDEKKSHS